MSILQEIFEWAEKLPDWQGDAVSRLFKKQSLSQEDIEDLYALLKTAHGIPDPKGRTAAKITADHIPAAKAQAASIEFLAVKDLKNVNAIAEGQRLPFGKAGLTVIYGDNGVGKSGYSRVLKRACRARDQSEEILPNALLANASGTPTSASAIFEVLENGIQRDIPWVDGTSSPQELASLAVFDSHCARSYLDEEGDFSYVPYGLDILQELGKAFVQLDAAVKKELSQNDPGTSAFLHLTGDGTAVSGLIQGLSADTKPERVETLATLTEDEVAAVSKMEAALKTDNPKEKAVQVRQKSSRIARVHKSVLEKGTLVNDASIANIRKLCEDFYASKAAAAKAAEGFKDDKALLPGTGGDAWKELFEAAKKFCLEAHPERKLSQLQEGDSCPLCQQPLKEGAARLMLFEKFLQDETEKRMLEKRTLLAAAFKPATDPVITLGLDEELASEIDVLVPQLSEKLKAFEQGLVARQGYLREACRSNVWDDIAVLDSPASQIQILVDALNQKAAELDKAGDDKARVEMQAALKELIARQNLGKVKAAVLAAIERKSLQAKLTKCGAAVKTNGISAKSAELTHKAVSKELETKLNNEFKALGVSTLNVSLKEKNVKGKSLYKLKMETPQSKSPVDVLSEGEQRAIALGSFLAEVNVIGGAGGIIFDDPVSSLDHKRRERVAARLVKEAANRQVIILTHDVYFLCILMEYAKRDAVECLTQSLSRTSAGYGVADPVLPFGAMGTVARIGAMRNENQAIAKLHKDGDEAAYKARAEALYQDLRDTWERAVEEVLFQGTVVRFRKGVETQKLAAVIVDTEDFVAVDSGMTKCSNYTHDRAAVAGMAVPEPSEILADIEALEAWRSKLIAKQEAVRKVRKPK